MAPLVIQPTHTTPYVNFDPALGVLELKGRSTPENPIAYYDQMMQWVEEYKDVHPRETTVRVFFEYFNTSSSKCLLELMKKIKTIDSDVKWVWMYENGDDDMREAGADFSDLLKVKFSLIPMK